MLNARHIYQAVLLVALLNILACEESTRFLAVEPVKGPAVADILDLVSSKHEESPRLMARTYDQIWYHDDLWNPVLQSNFATFVDPASIEDSGSGAWFKGYFWWTTRNPAPQRLVRSVDGKKWEDVNTPSATAGDDAYAYEILSSGQLVANDEHLYYVTPRSIWSSNNTPNSRITWNRHNLDGIDLTESLQNAPKLIRNYLPATSERPFEVVTVFQSGLRIYRRETGSSSFYLVSSLPTFDRQILASNDGAFLFIVAPEGIYRSNDQGETWFRFFEPDHDTIVCADYVERKNNLNPLDDETDDAATKSSAVLLIGTEKGYIYRSLTNGEQWQKNTVDGDSGRRIVKIISSDDGTKIWLGVIGLGVFVSVDQGENWNKDSKDFRSSRPFDIDVTNNDSFIMADMGGLWRLPKNAEISAASKSNDDGTRWQHVAKQNISAFVTTGENTYVAGTLFGNILVIDKKGNRVAYFRTSNSENLEEGESEEKDDYEGPSVRSEYGLLSLNQDSIVFLRRRKDGSEIQGWYRNGRVVTSKNNGESWEPLDIPPATVQVFQDQEIIDVQLAGTKTTIILTESGMSERNLWVSNDHLQTWMELEWTLPEQISSLRVLEPTDGDKLSENAKLIVQAADKIYVSHDHGISWSLLPGPWKGLSVVQIAIHGKDFAALVDSRLGYELIVAKDLFADSVSYERFPLSWPEGYPKDLPKLLVLGEDLAGILSSDGFWIVQVGIFERTVSRAVLVVSQLFVIIILTGVVFLVLRTRIRRLRSKRR